MNDDKKSKNLGGVIPPHWMSGLGSDSKSKSSKSSLSPRERVGMIERAYKDILNREPDTRDLNYYKYSSASEETIRQELLESEEHKTLIENGREFQKTKNLLDDAESKINALKGEINDGEESLKQMEDLLKEKNLHIEDIKKKLKSQFDCSN